MWVWCRVGVVWRSVAVFSSLVAWRWVRRLTQLQPMSGALIRWLVPDAFRWLAPPCLRLQFFFFSSISGSWALLFILALCVNLIGLFLCVVRCIGWEASVRSLHFLCISGNRVSIGVMVTVVHLSPRWLRLMSFLGRLFCCC